MKRLHRGEKSLTVRHHKRSARSHLRCARIWELECESDFARTEWSRGTIHRRTAQIKRQLAEPDERKAS
jgi:hypothetical protein